MKKITLISLMMIASFSQAEVSSGNKISRLIITADASSNSHLVQWVDPIHDNCKNSNGTYRTRISTRDKGLLSALLTAKVSDLNVSFTYDLSTTSSDVPGHESGSCQIRNIWF